MFKKFKKVSYNLINNMVVVDINECKPLVEEVKVMFFSSHKVKQFSFTFIVLY